MTLFRRILWIGVALGGAFALGGVALHRGESINALWIVAAAVCVYALGCRFYSAWIAARVLTLVESHYYDGQAWHRVEPDFVIQGPSPGDNEYVGSTRFLRDELGTVPHVRGTVGMSTRGHDTGDAQWFVNLKDNRRLGRDYSVFGEIVEGIEIADGVLEGDVIDRIEVLPTH